MRKRSVDQKARDTERLEGLRGEHELPPVEGVRDGSTGESQRQQRHERGEGKEPERERRVRQLVELERQRDERDLRPEERHRLAYPEPPVVRVVAEWREVDRDAQRELAPRRAFLRCQRLHY